MDAEDEAAEANADLDRLLRRQRRQRIPASASDVRVARDRQSSSQALLAAAKAEARVAQDMLWSFDATEFPEARYYVHCVASCQPQGLDLLHASGLLVDRSLDGDYEVGASLATFTRAHVTHSRLVGSPCRRTAAYIRGGDWRPPCAARPRTPRLSWLARRHKGYQGCTAQPNSSNSA